MAASRSYKSRLGAKNECHRSEQKKQWKWIGGGEISYDLKYWKYGKYPNGDPTDFTEPGCLYMYGAYMNGATEPILIAYGCEKNTKFDFLCQF
jgi:hypothetical protein